ncbi:MAG: ribosomal RNA small subunit methyltransferase A, partial [Deltaproteobacteria bacterium]|nr:ribosomal RNA small subunit methyltransferase A [Deltaproteobacteria bacterium]
VAPEAFFPRPEVKSTILKIELFPVPQLAPEYLPVLRELLRAAFGQRRKTLSNTMAVWLGRSRGEIEGLLRSQDIDPKRRGESLTVDEFKNLTQAVSAFGPLPLRAEC